MSDREDMVALGDPVLLAKVLRSRGKNNTLHDIERAADMLERSTARTGPDVAVKPLEWHQNGTAKSIFGNYKISAWDGGSFTITRPGHYPNNVSYESEEAAKAAAQADYEQHIRSALTATVVTAGKEVTAGAFIKLRPDEIQSGLDRVKWAEGLIRQLPDNHDGRNSWLLNYAGEKHEADKVAALSAQPQPEAEPIFLGDPDSKAVAARLRGYANEPYRCEVAEVPRSVLFEAAQLLTAPDARLRVKQLEWVEDDDNGRAMWRARTDLGPVYTVYDDGFSTPPYRLCLHQLHLGSFNIVGVAQSAAQADFEQRIRSALSPAGADEGKESEGGKTHVVTLEDQTCDRCEGTGIVSTTKCPQCLGEGSYETSVMAKCVHPSDLTQREAWPDGCRNPNSCSIHRDCMYLQCKHYTRDISGEVDAALLRGGQ